MSAAGGREAFLENLRRRIAAGIPENHVRPWIPAAGPPPEVRFSDPVTGDLVERFLERVQRVAGVGRRIPDQPDRLAPVLANLCEQLGVRRAVVSADSICEAARALLGAAGDATSSADAASADLGVTGAAYAIAATGSLVLETARPDVRHASLLPPVHLAIVSAAQMLATPGDLFRHFGERFDGGIPRSLTLVTGPSRSADIEMQLILGVHGPKALWVVVLE